MIRMIIHRGLILFAGILFLPGITFGAKECRVIEYPDRYEAVCVGDPNYTVKQPEQADSSGTTKGAEVSLKRRHIQEIRNLNAHRLDLPDEKSSDRNIPAVRSDIPPMSQKGHQ